MLKPYVINVCSQETQREELHSKNEVWIFSEVSSLVCIDHQTLLVFCSAIHTISVKVGWTYSWRSKCMQWKCRRSEQWSQWRICRERSSALRSCISCRRGKKGSRMHSRVNRQRALFETSVKRAIKSKCELIWVTWTYIRSQGRNFIPFVEVRCLLEYFGGNCCSNKNVNKSGGYPGYA